MAFRTSGRRYSQRAEIGTSQGGKVFKILLEFQQEFLDCITQTVQKELQSSSRGMRRLQSAVPKDTGRLREGFEVRQQGRNTLAVKNTTPYAKDVHYNQARRYGARTPRQTMRRWMLRDVRALNRRAAKYCAERAIAAAKRRAGV